MADEEDFDVERIIGHRLGSDGRSEYLIRWSGYGQESDSWEPEENIHQKSLIDDYIGANKLNGNKVTIKYTSKRDGRSVTLSPENNHHPEAVNEQCANGHSQDDMNRGVFHLTIKGLTQTITFPIHPYADPNNVPK